MKPNTNVVNGIVFRDNLKRITTLGLFDKMAAHLRQQRAVCRPQSNSTAGCAFRNADGTMACAVGAIITDEVYKSYNNPNTSDKNDLEADGLYHHGNELVREAVERSIRRPTTQYESQLFRAVQKIHDDLDPDQWDAALTERRGLLLADIKEAKRAA